MRKKALKKVKENLREQGELSYLAFMLAVTALAMQILK